MKKDQLKQYKTLMAQGLSIRAMARILKLPIKTTHDRIRKIQQTGNLTHGNTGRKNRKPRSDKQLIVDLANGKYADFNITHTCELLAEREGVAVDRETLRRWLGRKRTRRIPKQRQRRECSPNFGDLLQIDGSFHDWYGGVKTCLINIVDDATKITEVYISDQETIESACYAAWRWFREYGVPRAFYADERNMYHLNPDSEHNFFTSMWERLGIRVILAHSSQAKGRVERSNQTLQGRLVPLLKLDGVKDMDSANAYLADYIVSYNKRFSISAREGNSHTPLPDGVEDIDDVCFIMVERQLKNDWTFSYKDKIYQIPRQSIYPPAKSKIQVKITISGHIAAYYRCAEFIVR